MNPIPRGEFIATLENIIQEFLYRGESFMVSGGRVFPVIETDLVSVNGDELSWNIYTGEEIC